MIQMTAQTRILVALDPQDFRNGIDGLVRVCRQVLESDPFTGTVFCFRNRRGTSVKLLFYDSQGFWLCQKRLSAGKFRWWPREGEAGKRQMAPHELQLLLWNGDPSRAAAAAPWRPVAMAA